MPRLDYSQLTDEEAQGAFEGFVAAGPERVASLRAEVGEDVLDFSPESLVPLWEWFVRRQDAGEDSSGDFPDWYTADQPTGGQPAIAPGTVRDIERIGYYLAEVFLRNADEAEWAIARLAPRMQYAHQNKPVVKISGLDVDPIGVAFTLLARLRRGTGREPDGLLRTYRANLT
jgi:hypothetical protein